MSLENVIILVESPFLSEAISLNMKRHKHNCMEIWYAAINWGHRIRYEYFHDYFIANFRRIAWLLLVMIHLTTRRNG